MWFMPSYGRPERLRDLLQAPGGWPDKVIVLVNKDDPKRAEYERIFDLLPRSHPWRLVYIPEGSRCADAHRWITAGTAAYPNEDFYGLLCDDHWPVTKGWHQDLVLAAGNRWISGPAGEANFPLLRSVVVLGGDLVRAMGSIVPAPVKHNFEDNIWDRIAADFNILVPLDFHTVEHKHWIHGTAGKDATYERGSADYEADAKIFQDWLNSPERKAMSQRIGKLLGVTGVTTLDPKSVRLAIIVPIGDEHVDIAYHKSLNATIIELGKRGISLKILEVTGGSNVGKARERLLWMAMHDEAFKATHFACIDADMGWKPDQLIRLLAADHEFSAIAGVRKTDELKVCCNFLPKDERHPVTNFLKVRDVGFAFVMLKRSVIDKLCKAYPELEYNAGPDKREWALFMEMIDKSDRTNGRNGERLSEDFAFCRRWRKINGDIWLDDEAAIIHAGRKEYSGSPADARRQAASSDSDTYKAHPVP